MPVAYRNVTLFFALACALTWAGWLGNYLWPAPYWPLPMNPLGPLIAAPLTIWLLEGRAGLAAGWRRILNFRAPLWVYATAFLLPLGAVIASIWLAIQAGAPTQTLPQREWLEFVILVPVMLIMGPLEEELTFRGYGQVELQRTMSPLAAAILIGLGVVVWHIPLFLIGSIELPYLIILPSVSVVYAWLYQKGGSIWPVVLLHFTVNYFGGEWLGQMILPQGQFMEAVFHTAIYVAVALLIVWREGPTLDGASRRKARIIPAG